MPSTHPVAGSPAPDAASALQNFDGISYAKGAATLRQLIAYIGDDAFLAGVRDHLTAHAYGNADLADFLAAMERASGKDLHGVVRRVAAHRAAWTRSASRWRPTAAWSPRPGCTARRSRRASRCRASAQPGRRRLHRRRRGVPGRHRRRAGRHRAARPGGPAGGAAGRAQRRRPHLGHRAAWTSAPCRPCPGSSRRCPTRLARAVLWTSLIDGVCLGTVDPRLMLRTFAAAWPAELNASVANRISGGRGRPGDPPVPAAGRAGGGRPSRSPRPRPGCSSTPRPARPPPLVAARRHRDDLQRHRAAAALGRRGRPARGHGGRHRPALAGAAQPGRVRARSASRRSTPRSSSTATLQGSLQALRAKASRPDAASKAWAWDQLTGDRGRSNYEMNELAAGFWTARDLDVVRPYVERYFTDVPAMAGRVGEDALARVATLGLPQPGGRAGDAGPHRGRAGARRT